MRFMNNKNIRLALFSWYALIFAVVTLSIAAAAQPDPVALLGNAQKYIAARESIQFDMSMVMDFKDGDNKANATITGSFILGKGCDAVIRLKADSQEMVVYNNRRKQDIYLVDKSTFRELSAELKRATLIKSVLNGPLETPLAWLADFLHGVEFTFEDMPTYAGVEEIDGVVYHLIDMLFPQCSVRAYLSVTDPSLLHRIVLDLRGATLGKYARTPEGSLRIMGGFTNWKLDEVLPENTFIFTPPPGVTFEKEDRSGASDPLIGQKAPDFALPLLEGGTVKLSQHRDKDIVILDFFASWCGPCRQAMPIVASVAKSFKDKNVVLYAVNLRETPDKVKSFIQSSNLAVTVLLDKGDVAAKYGVKGIPRLVIIGKDGIIKTVHGGMSPDLEKQLTDDINALL